MDFVSTRKWNLALAALALTIFGGAALAIALLLGAGNPPRASTLVLNLNSADDLTPAGTFGAVRLFALPATLTPPFTIEMDASSSGAQTAAWGVWLRVSDHYGSVTDYPMLIDGAGYVLSALTTLNLQHQQFAPIHPSSNRLAVDFDGDTWWATFRVNDEVFARLLFPVRTISAAGLALYGDPRLTWNSIKIYTG